MSKNIIITGTSRGIGLELVKELAQKGHHILALSRNTESIAKLNLENVETISFDLSNTENFETLTEILKQWQSVDILINNAGKLINKPFDKISIQEFKQVYQVNVFAVAQMIQTVLPFLSKASNVLNISSMGGVQGSVKFSGLSAYSSSKGALISLTELLAQEYENLGIHFNVLALGAVQTQMLQEAFPEYKTKTSAKQIAQYIADFVLHRAFLFNGKVIQVSHSTP